RRAPVAILRPYTTLFRSERVLETVEDGGPDAVAPLEDERVELVAKLGENVVIRGAVRSEAGEGESLSDYVHPPANKIGVLVRYRDRKSTRLNSSHQIISY